jgi:hypothetical protein
MNYSVFLTTGLPLVASLAVTAIFKETGRESVG